MTVIDLWVYLSASPLLWLTATLCAYVVADRIAAALGRHPAANPVMIAVVLLSVLLLALGVNYRTYFEGAQFIHFLLGPATVALAVPLYRHWPTVRANIRPMAVSLVAGSAVAIVSTIVLARMFGLPEDVLLSLAPRSVTAPVAMGISERIGGLPSLTAVVVILTGILGAMIVTPLMNALRIRDYAARGFAVGLAAHGIGTARALHVDPIAGVFAGIAMGANAVLTATLLPWLLRQGWF
jgi:predicted murein hydrolase (TIGR00659 family)